MRFQNTFVCYSILCIYELACLLSTFINSSKFSLMCCWLPDENLWGHRPCNRELRVVHEGFNLWQWTPVNSIVIMVLLLACQGFVDNARPWFSEKITGVDMPMVSSVLLDSNYWILEAFNNPSQSSHYHQAGPMNRMSGTIL